MMSGRRHLITTTVDGRSPANALDSDGSRG